MPQTVARPESVSFALHGLPVSHGIAIGYAHLISHALLEVHHYVVSPKATAKELTRLDDAIAAVGAELDVLRHTQSAAASEVAVFVDLQRMLLQDPLLIEEAREHIRTRRCNAEWALVQQMEVLVEQFDAIEDAYLRERKADVVQLVERLVKNLLGHPGYVPPKQRDGFATIVVAHDLSPSDTIHFKDAKIAGFVTDIGGATSHTAIVARSLAIPAVVGLQHVRHTVNDGDVLIVDGTRGVVIVAPDERVLEEYRIRQGQLELERSKLKRITGATARTLDTERVFIKGNIELPRDAQGVREVEADGVGLFRTEFLFMGRDELPDEDEQFEAYRSVLKALPGKPVTIRTLDIGADKALRGMEVLGDQNPALGLRAIRYCLAEPRMFLTQLRALLRASQFGQLQIMLPMLATLDEITQSLAMLERAKAELRAEKVKFADGVPVGGMIEIPAAALSVGLFARKLDFLSIGTNDLIQYTLAIDRTDAAVSHLYDPWHPAVLLLIHRTIQTGLRTGVPVSVCGEMAGDVANTRLLLGMGLRDFSMHPAQILEVKQEILRAHTGELAVKVGKLMKLDEPDKVREAIQRL
ncbi:phosphoenolpyruvate--protein phosphotransferase [Niveibacterium sp.]|uniref:phosphoenolpyruvate--protein phosphotransferase n=1 Tax=Niveibacterium sp. TaxID=2017444 RepID=UPI0035B2C6E4